MACDRRRGGRTGLGGDRGQHGRARGRRRRSLVADGLQPSAGQAILGDALDTHGNRADGPCWTTARASGTTRVEMLVCRPARRDQRDGDWDGFVEHIDRRLPRADVEVLAGVLPARTEVTCTVHVDHGDEAASTASGYAPHLAINGFITTHGLRPLNGATRELLPTGPDEESLPTTTVRDVEVRT